MCEFCDFEKQQSLLDEQGKETHLCLMKFMGYSFVKYRGIPSKKNVAVINFCPICGRDLTGEQNHV